jgi:hypothetical protein
MRKVVGAVAPPISEEAEVVLSTYKKPEAPPPPTAGAVETTSPDSFPPPPPPPSFSPMVTGAGCFIGVGMLEYFHYYTGTDYTMVVGSLGASATIVFGYPSSPFGQPR